MGVKVNKRKWEQRPVQVTVMTADEAMDNAFTYPPGGNESLTHAAVVQSFSLFDADGALYEGWAWGMSAADAVKKAHANFRAVLDEGLFKHDPDWKP